MSKYMIAFVLAVFSLAAGTGVIAQEKQQDEVDQTIMTGEDSSGDQDQQIDDQDQQIDDQADDQNFSDDEESVGEVASYGNNSSGFYVSFNPGMAMASLPSKEDYKKGTKNGFSAGGFVGYQINSFVGVELGYMLLPNYDYKDNDGNKAIKLKENAVVANVVGRYPIANTPISVVGKVGTAYVMAKQTDVATNKDTKKKPVVLTAGVAIEYAVPKVNNLYASVNYTYQDKKKYDSQGLTIPQQNMFAVGIRYQF